jgi:hypothetical protein
MNAEPFDKGWVGIALGLVFPILGFFAYGLLYTNVIRPHLSLDFFIREMFLGTREYQAPILSLGLIADIPLFFLLDRKGWYRAMRGVISSMFIFAVVIVVLWM